MATVGRVRIRRHADRERAPFWARLLLTDMFRSLDPVAGGGRSRPMQPRVSSKGYWAADRPSALLEPVRSR